MHHIYHTHAFVLGNTNTGEANKFLTLFTRELGVVSAHVQGVRHLRSRLRFSLQDFSYAKVDLVRGKEIWRVTSAGKINEHEAILHNHEKRMFVANIFNLLRRLCPGEEVHEALYDDVQGMFTFLENESIPNEALDQAEIILVLRILYHLGYIAHGERTKDFILSPYSLELITSASTEKQSIVREINTALRESQL
ncbi:MAG: DNA repair protein RecO [Candidatus Paceibacterota bacterium]|jgi:DNA repair protein RecO